LHPCFRVGTEGGGNFSILQKYPQPCKGEGPDPPVPRDLKGQGILGPRAGEECFVSVGGGTPKRVKKQEIKLIVGSAIMPSRKQSY